MLFKPLNIWYLVMSDGADNTVSKYVNIIPYLVDILIIPNSVQTLLQCSNLTYRVYSTDAYPVLQNICTSPWIVALLCRKEISNCIVSNKGGLVKKLRQTIEDGTLCSADTFVTI